MSESYSAGVTPDGKIIVERDGEDITPHELHIAASLSRHDCNDVDEAIEDDKILLILAQMAHAGRRQMSLHIPCDPF